MPEIADTTENHVMDFLNNIGPLAQAAAIQSNAVALYTAAQNNPDLQDTISQAQTWMTDEVKKLESDLGQPLFQRGEQSLSPAEILIGALYTHAATNLGAAKQAVNSFVTGRSPREDFDSFTASIEPDFSLALLQETSRRANASPEFAKQLKVAAANATMIGKQLRALQNESTTSLARSGSPSDTEAAEGVLAFAFFYLFFSWVTKK